MVPPLATFDFTAFAREIYADPERPVLGDEEQYLLPALYGGDLGDGEGSIKYAALVVFQNPLFTFTKERWKTPCTSPTEAIKRHRQIFFQWLTTKETELGELVRELADSPSNAEDLFRRVYVTDIWKDAKDTRDVNNSKKHRLCRDYWRSKLKIEVATIAAERVIFIGKEARWGSAHVPNGTRQRSLVFPAWGKNRKIFTMEVRKLIADIRGGTF
ncbi:MAG: hypothetical protein ABIR70_14225 [Bryobacteraceae bacterium]